ncbi:hypothetical protein [Sporosarcina sp. YIM B06819]|uniref:hypothetical protein n=1 Tax=Sporosarcina sp. YIM B06819 TaxID=3081769 RepID=UPI00298CCD67|nr:hypothetical protein [Sporosarcina sp. YIM B06819]
MNQQRKRIIISEIKYWKHNKLLPAHYCDFLITLYARGEEDNEREVKASESIFVKEKKSLNRTVFFLSILAVVVSAGMFIFTQYPGMTMTLAAVLAVAFLLITLRKKANQALAPFLYIIVSFMLLIMSLKVWFVFFEGHTMLLLGLLMLNCSLWLFAGRLLKLLYFTISGTAGILLIIGFLLLSF